MLISWEWILPKQFMKDNETTLFAIKMLEFAFLSVTFRLNKTGSLFISDFNS